MALAPQCRKKRTMTFYANGDTSRPYSLAEMLESNAEDPGFCEWLRTAKPGDVFLDADVCQCVEAA